MLDVSSYRIHPHEIRPGQIMTQLYIQPNEIQETKLKPDLTDLRREQKKPSEGETGCLISKVW